MTNQIKNQIYNQEYKPNKYGWGTWNNWNNRKSNAGDKPKDKWQDWAKRQAKENNS